MPVSIYLDLIGVGRTSSTRFVTASAPAWHRHGPWPRSVEALLYVSVGGSSERPVHNSRQRRLLQMRVPWMVYLRRRSASTRMESVSCRSGFAPGMQARRF